MTCGERAARSGQLGASHVGYDEVELGGPADVHLPFNFGAGELFADVRFDAWTIVVGDVEGDSFEVILALDFCFSHGDVGCVFEEVFENCKVCALGVDFKVVDLGVAVLVENVAQATDGYLSLFNVLWGGMGTAEDAVQGDVLTGTVFGDSLVAQGLVVKCGDEIHGAAV